MSDSADVGEFVQVEQTLTGDLTNARESFLKVLGINMLTLVMEQLMNCVAPFPSFPDTTPQCPVASSPVS